MDGCLRGGELDRDFVREDPGGGDRRRGRTALQGWQPTRRHLSRLSAASKHHLADPALAARLLGATRDALLENAALGPPVPRDGTLLGALFESLVTLCVRVYAQGAEATTGHLRTFSGEREADLIVEALDKRVVAVEVKLKRTVADDDVRNLRWLQSKIGDELLDAIVITTGESAYGARMESAWSRRRCWGRDDPASPANRERCEPEEMLGRGGGRICRRASLGNRWAMASLSVSK